MKKHYRYVLYESLLILALWGMFLALAIWLLTPSISLITVGGVITVYFLYRIGWGIRLLVDISHPSVSAKTEFSGVKSMDTLDFLHHVRYSNLAFRDLPRKTYYAFEDLELSEFHPGDRVEISYYRFSGIVTEIRSVTES